jgi:hypothetical protein
MINLFFSRFVEGLKSQQVQDFVITQIRNEKEEQQRDISVQRLLEIVKTLESEEDVEDEDLDDEDDEEEELDYQPGDKDKTELQVRITVTIMCSKFYLTKGKVEKSCHKKLTHFESFLVCMVSVNVISSVLMVTIMMFFSTKRKAYEVMQS